MNSIAQALAEVGIASEEKEVVAAAAKPEATHKKIFGGKDDGPLVEISLPQVSRTDWPCSTQLQFDTEHGYAFFGKNFSHVEGGVWVNFFVYGDENFLKSAAGKKVVGRLELQEKTVPACDEFPERKFVLVNLYLSRGKAVPTHRIYVGDKLADKSDWDKFTTSDMKGICVAVTSSI